MTPLLTTTLVAHVILGIAAIGLLHIVLMQTLKKNPSWKWAGDLASGATFLFFTSWVSAAYYYVNYYGSAVKPVIKTGDYAWAHSVFMEGKEHIFIILPILTLLLTMALRVLERNPETDIRRPVTALCATLVVLSIFVALAGVAVSGAAR